MAVFSKKLAVDLGTANVLVYVAGKGIVMREPSIVAVSRGGSGELRAIGEEARTLAALSPQEVTLIKPLKDGVVADYIVTEELLRFIIHKFNGRKHGLAGAVVVVCVPCGVSEVERRAVEEAVRKAGAREVYVILEPLAAAIGAGLEVEQPEGRMIVDFGGGTTEIAVLSLDGVVLYELLRLGGMKLDEVLVKHLRKTYNIHVGEKMAEELKTGIGSAVDTGYPTVMNVRGRSVEDGLPATVAISADEVREVLSDSLRKVTDAIKTALEKTPPELAADIMKNGITLTGGGARLTGIDVLIEREIGVKAWCAQDPMDCVALGAGRIVEEYRKYAAQREY